MFQRIASQLKNQQEHCQLVCGALNCPIHFKLNHCSNKLIKKGPHMCGPFFINYLHNPYSILIEYKTTVNVLPPKHTYRS